MKLSIVIPIFNEEQGIPELRKRLESVLKEIDVSHEIVLVDDGSRDRSLELMLGWAHQAPNVKVISFTRNFGHQIAITAGLDVCTGDAVVTMDADLQDPPELISAMWEKFREGFDLVLAQRMKRANESALKLASAYLFYRLMKTFVQRDLPADCGDFRLLSRPALLALRKMKERHRFVRGMIAWLGFKQTIIQFNRNPRFAGNTHYPWSKMFRLSWDAAISFSNIPLRLSVYLGFLTASTGFFYGTYAVYHAWVRRDVVPGWTSSIVLLCLLGGMIMFCLGIIGEYIGKIFEEIKGRPLYITNMMVNFEESAPDELARKRN